MIESASGQKGVAFRFQPLSFDMYLTGMQLAVTFQTGTPEVMVGIASDNSGVPGTVTDLQTLNLQASFVNGIDNTQGYLSEIVNYTPGQKDFLMRGATYWIVAMGDGQSSLFWNYNSFGPNGGVNDVYARLVTDFTQTPPVDVWKAGFTTQGAFAVTGVEAPEPSSFMMIGAAALALGFAGVRPLRNKRPAARS